MPCPFGVPQPVTMSKPVAAVNEPVNPGGTVEPLGLLPLVDVMERRVVAASLAERIHQRIEKSDGLAIRGRLFIRQAPKFQPTAAPQG